MASFLAAGLYSFLNTFASSEEDEQKTRPVNIHEPILDTCAKEIDALSLSEALVQHDSWSRDGFNDQSSTHPPQNKLMSNVTNFVSRAVSKVLFSDTSRRITEHAIHDLESDVSDDFLCPICLQLLYEPISTVCGHTFCYKCLCASYKRKKCCPVCRESIRSQPSRHGIHILMRRLILDKYPHEYRQRTRSATTRSNHSIPSSQLSTTSYESDSAMTSSVTSQSDYSYGYSSSDDEDSIYSYGSASHIYSAEDWHATS